MKRDPDIDFIVFVVVMGLITLVVVILMLQNIIVETTIDDRECIIYQEGVYCK